MSDANICTEGDLAKLNILSRTTTDKLKFFQDFSQLLKDRVNIQENYVQEISKFTLKAETLLSQGVFSNIFSAIKVAYQEKLKVEQNFLDLLKKDLVDAVEKMTKKQTTEFNVLLNERKLLEKEHLKLFERMEMSKKSYFLHGRDRDAVALEKECLSLPKKQSDARQKKASDKLNNMNKIWTNSETEYKKIVGEYNTFLEKFGTAIRTLNNYLTNYEEERVITGKISVVKLLDNEPGLCKTSCEETKNLKDVLEKVDVKKELEEVLKEAALAPQTSLKIEVETYQSFFLKEMSEPKEDVEEEIIQRFRSYYEEVVKGDSPPESYNFKLPVASSGDSREQEGNINCLIKLVDAAWRGSNVETEDLKKFHQMLGDQLLRKIFIVAVQQYRLSGKFILTENGFANTTKILVHFLYACMNIKDALSIMKVMVLSLTFWKVDESNQNEKHYLHSKVTWHPIWRDFDFWTTSIYLSIKEELRNQRGLEAQEDLSDTADRENTVIFGQLLSFSHNMVTFMVEKNEVKKIIEKFCAFYDFQAEKRKILLNNIDTMIKQQDANFNKEKAKKEEEQPKPIRISIISNYFGKKNSISSDDSKSTTDNNANNNNNNNSNQKGQASQMMEKFRKEYEDEDLFLDIYGKKGFSYGSEPMCSSLENFAKKGFSYEEDLAMNKLTESPMKDETPTNTDKKSFIWF